MIIITHISTEEKILLFDESFLCKIDSAETKARGFKVTTIIPKSHEKLSISGLKRDLFKKGNPTSFGGYSSPGF